MPVALEQFVRRVTESSVLSQAELTSLLAGLPAEKQPADGEAFAKLLVKEKKLTAYQAQQIYGGKGKSLVLGNYVILDKIGAGGMGQVFKARHKRMNRLVAIKLLPPEVNRDEATIQRFHREVHAAAKLTHPNIVIAYDADEAPGGLHFLVMEYVAGKDLAHLVAQQRNLPLANVLNYILQAAKGLAYAHENGVVHRDIKPANLLLDEKGAVKILDMGLARLNDAAALAAKEGLTKTGDVMGTVDYMAPEQAFDTHNVDGRADIYSLGCTLYRLLTGKNLYDADSLIQKLMAHQSKPVPSLQLARNDVPFELEAAFEKMVAKHVNDRFQNMGEVIAALQLVHDSLTNSATPQPSPPESRLHDFFGNLTGGKTKPHVAAVATSEKPVAQISNPALDATINLSHPAQGTDPVSDRSINVARTLTPQPRLKKKPAGPWWRNRNVLIAAGAGGFLLVLLGIWVIIKDNNGKEVARIQVPEGGRAEIKEVVEAPETKPSAFPQTSGTAPPIANATQASGNQPNPRWPFDPPDGKAYEWSQPENLGANINSADRDILGGMSADNRTIYLLRNNKVFSASRDNPNEAFGNLSEIFPFDKAENITVSSNELVMCIERIIPFANELWISARQRTTEKWPAPVRAAAPVNADLAVLVPVLSADGLTLLAASTRAGSHNADVWLFTRSTLDQPFGAPERLPEPVNSPHWDMPYYISNDRCLLISSNQMDSTVENQGQTTSKPIRKVFYYTRKQPTEPFGTGTPLGIPLGTAENSDYNAGFRLSSDGRTIYFESIYSTGSFGYSDIWVSRRVPKTKAASPPPAKAPFNATEARAHQEAWAKHLGVKREFTNRVGMKFVLIPPGEFHMGIDPAEIDLTQLKLDEAYFPSYQAQINQAAPRHEVELTRPYYLQVDEVTIGQYQQLLGKLPQENDPARPNAPVMKYTSLVEGVAFCNALSKLEGKTAAFETEAGVTTRNLTADGYRLPTEAEWEFACRAGTKTAWFFGDQPHGPAGKSEVLLEYQFDAERRPSPKPNPFGLLNVYGGATELCYDRFQPFAAAAAVDPFAEPENGVGIARGGGNSSSAGADVMAINSFARQSARPDYPHSAYNGFGRVLLPITLEKE